MLCLTTCSQFGLKKKSSEQENAQKQKKSNDNNFDETHGQFLAMKGSAENGTFNIHYIKCGKRLLSMSDVCYENTYLNPKNCL